MKERLIFFFLKQIYFSSLSWRSAPIPGDSRPPVSLPQINSFYKSIVLWLNIGKFITVHVIVFVLDIRFLVWKAVFNFQRTSIHKFAIISKRKSQNVQRSYNKVMTTAYVWKFQFQMFISKHFVYSATLIIPKKSIRQLPSVPQY